MFEMRLSLYSSALFLILCFISLTSCAEKTPTFNVIDRVPGTFEPLGTDSPSENCDPKDETHCLLPWPSERFLIKDESTPTGVRVSASLSTLNATDDGASLSYADGFSTVSTVLFGFERGLSASALVSESNDPTQGVIQTMLIEHEDPDQGQWVPLKREHVTSKYSDADYLLADPLVPMKPASEYVSYVTMGLTDPAGIAYTRNHATNVILDLTPPATLSEAQLKAYYAPILTVLKSKGVVLDNILRITSFITRSEANARGPVETMITKAKAKFDDEGLSVSISNVFFEPNPASPILAIVIGSMRRIPKFYNREGLNFENGALTESGTVTAPFRIVLPRGTGDYHFVMFGHGAGGDYTDDLFDVEFARAGVAKIAIRIGALNSEEVVDAFTHLINPIKGSAVIAGEVAQSIANAVMLRSAMTTSLGDVLSAATLGNQPNQAEGRRPISATPIWLGGSLGGTIGLVYAGADPSVNHAILNVPGAAWSHWVLQSYIFDSFRSLLATPYVDPDLDMPLAVAIGQINFDLIDGVSWYWKLKREPEIFLVQESVGDPVLPNDGNEMVARVTGAKHIGAAIHPVYGLTPATEVANGSAFTQYKVQGSGPYVIHGFAADPTPAGMAAFEQSLGFANSVWDGSPLITVPSGCENMSCDFTQ